MEKSWDKIRLKAGPKQYKTAPGPTGKSRLMRSVNGLLLAASRLERKSTAPVDDRTYAGLLAAALQDFIRTGQTLHRCDNCGRTMAHPDEAKDLWERVDPGGPTPSGECPHCGALCYPVEAE